MTHLIGVIHYECNLPKLIEYVDSTFGTPRSLMLELSPDWRRYRHHNNYFYQLALEYESRGTKIIPGDRYMHIVARLPNRFFDLEERLQKPNLPLSEKIKIKAAMSVISAAYGLRTVWNSIVPSKARKRNQGFVEVYDEEKPEVIIVGDGNAKYIKAQRPEVDYTYFTLKGGLFWVLDRIPTSFGRSIKPDSIHKA